MKRRLAQIVVLLLAAACSETSHLPTAPRANSVVSSARSGVVITPSGVVLDAEEYARFGKNPKVQTPKGQLIAAAKARHSASLRKGGASNLRVAGKSSNAVTRSTKPYILCNDNSLLLCEEWLNRHYISGYDFLTDADWPNTPRASFEGYDLIFVGDGAAFWDGLKASRELWGAAIHGRVAIMGLHLEHCGADDTAASDGSCNLADKTLQWINGGSGTGLLVSHIQAYDNSQPVLPSIAPFDGITYDHSEFNANDVIRISEPGHATMLSSTDASLSNWHQSAHNWFSGVGGLLSVAEACTGDYITEIAGPPPYGSGCSTGTFMPAFLVGTVGMSDLDGDGIADNLDNCPTVYNPGQEDDQNDGKGNVCRNAPIVTLSPLTQIIAANGSVTHTATATSANFNAGQLTYQWRVNGLIQAGETGSTFTHTYAANSAVQVTVKDPAKLSTFVKATVNIGSSNVAPAVSYTGAVSGNEGTPLSFSATATDADNDALAYAWDFGDGNTASTLNASHTFADNGNYKVTLTVSDGNGHSVVVSQVVAVANVAPSGIFSTAPGNAPANTPFAITVLGGTDASSVDASTLTYAFDCGTGVYSTASASNTVNCPAAGTPGPLTLHARIFDKDGGQAQYTASYSITNVSPSGGTLVAAPASVNEGQSFSLSAGSWTGTSSLTYAFDCGTGTFSTPSTSNSTTCSEPDNGSYTARVNVQDSFGGSTIFSTTVVSANVAPTATFGAPSGTITAGSSFVLALGQAHDDSPTDMLIGLQYKFDCGAGYGPYSSNASANCTATTLGATTLRGTVKDKDDGETEYTASVTVAKQSQTISLTAPATAANGTSFAITPTATSGNTVSVVASGACTLAGNTVTMTAGTGSCTLTANEPGNAAFAAATQVVTTTSASVGGQAAFHLTIPPTATVGQAELSASAVGGSGTGAITYSSTTPSVCSVDSNTGAITTLAAGTCSVTSTKAGDANYSAISETQSMTVALNAQTITFPQPASPAANGSSFTVNATTTGTSVTYTVTGGCSIAGSTVTMTSGSNDCVITANAAANGTYSAAAPVSRTVSAAKATQSGVTLTAPATATVGQGSLSASLAGGSGTGAVTYATSTPSVCSVDSNTGAITTLAAGSCSVTGTKASDANYNPASDIKTVTVGLNSQSITFPQPASPATSGTSFTVNATTTGTSVTYTVSGGCSIAGSTVTMTSGSNDCVITANAPANGTYSAAAPVSVTVAAKKLIQAPLVLTVPTTGRVGDTGLTATTTGGSGTGATTYATTTPSVCSVNATTGAITAIAAGTCAITVTKAGDTNYDPTSATKTLTVTPAVAATSLNLVTAPAGGASGKAFTTQPSVEVKDQYGNRLLVSGTMTATLTSGTGSLVGTVTVNVVNGIATWSTLGVSGAGNYTLTFSYNALSVSAPVVVISAYGVAFFDEPIRPTRLNIQQGGQTIPVKIWVPGAPASPTVIRSISNAAEACVNLPTGPDKNYDRLEEQAQRNSFSFSQNWQTDKAWAGTCRVLTVTLLDGSTYTAHFRFKAKNDEDNDDHPGQPGTGGTFGKAYFNEPIIPTRLNYQTAGSTLSMMLWVPGAKRGQNVIANTTSIAVSCPNMPAGNDEVYDAQEDQAQKLSQPVNGGFTATLATSASWAGTCRKVTVALTNGDAYDVYFKFRAPCTKSHDHALDDDDNDKWHDKGHFGTSRERDRH